MTAAALLVALAFNVSAKPPVDASKPGKSAARRVYDLARATGFEPAAVSNEYYEAGADRKFRMLQAPNSIGFNVIVTSDEGSPYCAANLSDSRGKPKEAAAMGLPVPYKLVDRRCLGLKKDITTEFVDLGVAPERGLMPKGATLTHLNSGHRARRGEMTQKQLDVLFSLIEDCLKNGI